MASQLHTYGPTCLLYDPVCEQSTTSQDPNEIPPPPKTRSQFFYLSPLPIDDPLTPVPPPGASSTSQSKQPPRPFSARDNIALEEAWQGLRNTVEDLAASNGVEDGFAHSGTDNPATGTRSAHGTPHGKREIAESSRTLATRESRLRPGLPHALQKSSQIQRVENASPPVEWDEQVDFESTLLSQKKQSIPIPGESKHLSDINTDSPGKEEYAGSAGSGPSTPRTGQRPSDINVSGSPFARAPIRHRQSPLFNATASGPGNNDIPPISKQSEVLEEESVGSGSKPGPQPRSRSSSEATKHELESTVTVGASRLHEVDLPRLQMKPIYWNPVQDIAPVLRATWFYKNTMFPVEPSFANQLEAGYMHLKPWTETWQDELNSCVENGAEAEMKIVHNIWPKADATDPGQSDGVQELGANDSSNRGTSSSKIRQESQDFQENRSAGVMDSDAARQFKNSSIIYVNAKDAQILRPSLLPSVSRGRKPLSSIRKGRQIGVAVVRGFNRQAWDKLHPSKLPSTTAKNFTKLHQKTSSAGPRRQICYACQMEDTKPNVSDLVLVIHGIGQKLSERMESFHFTHSINAFRRQVDIELNSESVWPHIRPGVDSIMVLPVNWRTTLSLEDADVEEYLSKDPSQNRFSLNDITPETIPTVRTLISDVMLDIPYYLSRHKQKMIQAVIKEANRIYRLWCHNNPGFRENGKVHLIAHSLGSIMAMDILTQQPTRPPAVDFMQTEISRTMFEFDTKNVFFCGSPAGLFLLLNKSTLLPRKGRRKPGWDKEDAARGIAGEAGTYGCMAIDNLYNIMHTTDPIAYHLNAAVDSDLANSLRPASVPSTSTSFLQSVGNVFRLSPSNPLSTPSSSVNRPGMTAKLPSNIELEIHDFTQEQIAETRMGLLNDNGQVDYSISGGGSALNIQYLNMLSAHSSYWVLPDFVRFIVVEIGRLQGRDATLLALRSEKAKGWKHKKA